MNTKTKCSLVVILALVITAGCKKDPDLTPEQVGFNTLKGTWTVNGGYVKVDGVDVTSSYSAFSITFSETTDGQKIYTVQNGSHAFPGIETDTWKFAGTGFTEIVRRHDGIVMSFTAADGFGTFGFTMPDPYDDGGRASGLSGVFEMKLQKR